MSKDKIKKKKNKGVLFGLLIVGVLVLLLIAGCSGPKSDVPASALNVPAHENVEETVVVNDQDVNDNLDDVEEHDGSVASDAAPVREIEIIAKQWEFIPDTIKIKQGETVELHLESQDVRHGFMVPELGINVELNPHRDEHVKFTADKKGTFPFFCSIPCGSGHSRMSGQIIVE